MQKFNNAWLDVSKINGVILTPKRGYTEDGLAVEVDLDEIEAVHLLVEGIDGVVGLVGENAKVFGAWWKKNHG